MQAKGKPTNSALRQALSHPRRIEILVYLTKKGTGTDEAELAEAFDLPVPRVKYHLLVLQGANWITPADDLEQGRYIAAASAGM
jgi:DNA-binding transcriptional ArsR family regulator